ncbi:DEAD/DEAH box helicase [Calidithermus chliarophilus]|uniref:DEAD/DEAH box helicase n=1 Tax=Calidithermus chliarophilus TaxID=52023 RepID=UPI0003FA0957|nr:DEAD/DEAH box helicase [Calidithermus chliarophilus]
MQQWRYLIYDERARAFLDAASGQRLPAEGAFPDGTVVLWDGAAATAFPVWLAPTDALPPGLPDTWCAAVARARTEGELRRAVAALTPVQAEEVLRTLPDELIHAWTGEPWPRPLAEALYRMSLDRYCQRLRARGVELRPVPAASDEPLSLDKAEVINPRPQLRPGQLVPLEALGLDERLARALVAGGAREGLFTHQALALEFLRAARREPFDLVLTTPTASGKTLAFAPGILEDLLQRGDTALFIYPLRALTTDQHDKLARMCEGLPLRVRSFFGSTSIEELLEGGVPHAVVATPDKLNYYLDRPELAGFFGHVRYIVLDEAHAYRGYVGINMALFLRRLMALTRSDVRLVVSTATLDNTADFVRRLTGRRRFRVVGASGAPVHARFYYRGVAKNVPSLIHVVQHEGRKGIAFVDSRAETRRLAEIHRRQRGTRVYPLFSGYRDYNDVLSQLRRGNEPMFVFSTTTLEAGIDIGDLQHVAILGFPSSRNSFKQMAGRAGRSGPAHVVFVPRTDRDDAAADKYYSRLENLQRLVEAQADPVYINPANPVLLRQHLRRMRWEAHRLGMGGGEELLERLLSPAAVPEAVRERLRQELAPLLAEPLAKADAPPLRSMPGRTYLVIRLGEGAPARGIGELTLDAETTPDWVLGELRQEAAHREWALALVSLHQGRYYRTIDWTQARVRRNLYSEEAVLVWAEDVTDRLMDPEEYNRAYYGAEPLARPDPRQVKHYHSPWLVVDPRLEVVEARAELGAVVAEAGRGRVRVGLELAVKRFTKTARFRCPSLRSARGVKGADGAGEWVVEDRDGRKVALDPSERWELLRSGSVVVPEPAREGEEPLRGRGYALQGWSGRRATVSVHAFSLVLPGTCSCGEETEPHYGWKTEFEKAPGAWEDHPVFSPLAREYETDLGQLRLSDGSLAAYWALSNALAKAIPNVLEADLSDIGFHLKAPQHELVFTAYDTVEGGIGVATQLPARLPEVLAEARRLLELSLRCECQGQGCYGCILPFRELRLPEDVPAVREAAKAPPAEQARLLLEETHRYEPEPSAAAAAHLLRNLLEPPSRPAPGAALPRLPEYPVFRRLVVALDGLLLDSSALPEAQRLGGDPGPLVEALRPFPRVTEVLEELLGGRVEVVLASNRPMGYVEAAVERHFPARVAAKLLGSAVASAGKPGTGRLQPLVEDLDPREVLLVGDRLEDVLAGRRLGVVSALATWGAADPAHALNAGPDLILPAPEDLLCALGDYRAYLHPLEQEGAPATAAAAPLRLARAGRVWSVLGRYLPKQPGGRRVNDLLNNARHQILDFKRSGKRVRAVADYLARHYPGLPVTYVPPRRPGLGGLDALAEELEGRGHPVLRALQWQRVPPLRQYDAGGEAERRANVAGALRVADPAAVRGLRLLLLDDLISSGQTLLEADRALVEAGARPEALALAYSLWERDRAAPEEERA